MFLTVKLCTYAKLFEIEHIRLLFEIEHIRIKINLALNNLQRLICHKSQTTHQPLQRCSQCIAQPQPTRQDLVGYFEFFQTPYYLSLRECIIGFFL